MACWWLGFFSWSSVKCFFLDPANGFSRVCTFCSLGIFYYFYIILYYGFMFCSGLGFCLRAAYGFPLVLHGRILKGRTLTTSTVVMMSLFFNLCLLDVPIWHQGTSSVIEANLESWLWANSSLGVVASAVASRQPQQLRTRQDHPTSTGMVYIPNWGFKKTYLLLRGPRWGYRFF